MDTFGEKYAWKKGLLNKVDSFTVESREIVNGIYR